MVCTTWKRAVDGQTLWKLAIPRLGIVTLESKYRLATTCASSLDLRCAIRLAWTACASSTDCFPTIPWHGCEGRTYGAESHHSGRPHGGLDACQCWS
eukprot:5652796-Amphidinium_carterae.1